MTGKIPSILGLDAGYVFRTHARCAQYEHIKTAASKVAEQSFVCTRVGAVSSHVKRAARTQDEAAAEKVADAVKERLFGVPTGKGDAQSQPVDAGRASVCPIDESS